MSKNPRTLYISYDGLLEPLGESQVVSYLEKLSPTYDISVLSFEKPEDARNSERMSEMQARLARADICWIPLRYHKWPPGLSTGYDIIRGVGRAFLWALAGRARVVHARSYVASLIAVSLKSVFDIKFLFDMRGFWADEKVDGGHWLKQSVHYKVTKRCERLFFESADAIVSLTSAGGQAFPRLNYRMRTGIPVEVIPTCTDLKKFIPGVKDPDLLSRTGLEGHLVIGCVGTMSNWYLRQSMLEYLACLARNLDHAKILIITHEDHAQLQNDALHAGIPVAQLVLVGAAFTEMPAYIRLIDIGVFFIKVCFSKKGSCATKLGEFLATGVPVVINDGIGDSGRILQEHDVGIVLSQLKAADFEASLSPVRQLVKEPQIAQRCRELATKYFDLDSGAEKYAALYSELTGTALTRAS